MTWEEYYDRYLDWADSTQVSRISQITTFGDPSQIWEVAQKSGVSLDDEFVVEEPPAETAKQRRKRHREEFFEGAGMTMMMDIFIDDLFGKKNSEVKCMARTITVKGIGKVSTRPDFVVLTMKLEAKDKEYDKAMELAAKQLEQLNTSLTAIGFEKESVKTTNFHVDTDYDSYKDKLGNYQRVFSGFVCRHNLKLSFDFDMKQLSQALAAIAACLAQPELSIAFTVKDPTAVNDALLREATINAKKKAELLCEASGVTLGQLLTIDYNWGELNIYSDTRYDMAEDCLMALPESAPSIDIEPDDIDVRDTATFVWELV